MTENKKKNITQNKKKHITEEEKKSLEALGTFIGIGIAVVIGIFELGRSALTPSPSIKELKVDFPDPESMYIPRLPGGEVIRNSVDGSITNFGSMYELNQTRQSIRNSF